MWAMHALHALSTLPLSSMRTRYTSDVGHMRFNNSMVCVGEWALYAQLAEAGGYLAEAQVACEVHGAHVSCPRLHA